MSSSAYASAFKNLGGAFQKRKPVSTEGSSSRRNREDAVESTAPQVVDPSVEPVENVIDVSGLLEARVPKKIKRVGVKPPKGKNAVPGEVVCEEEYKGPDENPVQIGNFTLEKLESTMSEIPSDQEWTQMEEVGLTTVLKRMIGHWGSCMYPSLFSTCFAYLAYFFMNLISSACFILAWWSYFRGCQPCN